MRLHNLCNVTYTEIDIYTGVISLNKMCDLALSSLSSDSFLLRKGFYYTMIYYTDCIYNLQVKVTNKANM